MPRPPELRRWPVAIRADRAASARSAGRRRSRLRRPAGTTLALRAEQSARARSGSTSAGSWSGVCSRPLRREHAVAEQFGRQVDQARAAQAQPAGRCRSRWFASGRRRRLFRSRRCCRACRRKFARPRTPARPPSRPPTAFRRPQARSRRWCQCRPAAWARPASAMPVARMPATVSPPTNPPITGIT